MNCKICGAQLSGTETVCPVCGAPIETINENTIPAAPAAPIPEVPVAPVEAAPVAPVAPVEAAPVAPIPETPVAPVEVAPAAPIPVTPVVPVEVAPVTPEPVAPVDTAPAAPIPETPIVPVDTAPVAPFEAIPTPEVPATPVAPVAPVETAPVEPYQAMPQPVMPQMNAPQEEKPVKQKRPVNTKFVIFMVVAILLIGFLLFWTYVVQADPKTPATPQTPETPEVVEETFTYNGQEFAIVDGYQYSTNDNYGAIISSENNTYTYEIDYTNSLEAYKNKLTEIYPDKASTMSKTIGNRDYYIVEVKDATEAIAKLYVTSTSDKYVVIGFITNTDYTATTDGDIDGLNAVLDGVTAVADFDKTTSTFGKDGVKLLTFDKTKLS